MKLVTQGFVTTSYRPNNEDEEVDIVVRYPSESRNLELLDSIKISTRNGLVALSYFVTRKAVPDDGILRRTDSTPSVQIQAGVIQDTLPDQVITDITKKLENDPVYKDVLRDVNWSFVGEQQDQKDSQAFLMKAFSVAIFMMAIILLLQFNSFSSAFFILSAVFMSSCGVLLGLMITGQPFGIIMSGIGVIALAGIVVNNNIVLIDTYDSYRAQNIDALAAITKTCTERFRPVVLTAGTTVLGLLPLAFAVNVNIIGQAIEIDAPSTQIWVQLASAIVFGLLFALPLTLLVTPSLIMLREKILHKLA